MKKNKNSNKSVLFNTAKNLIKDYVLFIDKVKTIEDLALAEEYPDLLAISSTQSYLDLFKEGLGTSLRFNNRGNKFSVKTQQFVASGITAILLKNGAYSLSVFNRYALFTLSDRIFSTVLAEVKVEKAEKEDNKKE